MRMHLLLCSSLALDAAGTTCRRPSGLVPAFAASARRRQIWETDAPPRRPLAPLTPIIRLCCVNIPTRYQLSFTPMINLIPSNVDMAPRDPILGVSEKFLADPAPHKINLGVVRTPDV